MRAYDEMCALVDFELTVQLDHLVHGEERWGLHEMQVTEESFGVEVE
jgi:hypothetical protein